MEFVKRLVPNSVKRLIRGMGGYQPDRAEHLQRSTAYFDIGQKSDALEQYFEPLSEVPGWFNVDDFNHR